MDDLLTPDDMVKRFADTDRQFWAQLRYLGTGPAYLKIGRKVYYQGSDVREWVESRKRHSTQKGGDAA